MSAGSCSLWSLQRILSHLFQLLGALGSPWTSLARSCISPISASTITMSSSPCPLGLVVSSLLLKTHQPDWIQGPPWSNMITSQFLPWLYLQIGSLSSYLWAAKTKCHSLSALETTEVDFSHFLRLESLRSGCQPGWVLVRALFWVADHQILGSTHGREQSKGSKLSGDSYKGINPIHGALPLWPHLILITCQRSHLLIPS